MLIVYLFVGYAHVNLCHIFSSSWCRGLAAASACGSSWTFLFTYLGLREKRRTSRGSVTTKGSNHLVLDLFLFHCAYAMIRVIRGYFVDKVCTVTDLTQLDVRGSINKFVDKCNHFVLRWNKDFVFKSSLKK